MQPVVAQPGTPSGSLLRLALGQAARQHAPGLLRQRAAYGRRPRYGAPRASANGYAPQDTGDNGFDQNGYGPDDSDFTGNGNGNGGLGMQGTWTRRGRTLTIQL